jgi:peptidoglycan hydrolase CwlO-like protein
MRMTYLGTVLMLAALSPVHAQDQTQTQKLQKEVDDLQTTVKELQAEVRELRAEKAPAAGGGAPPPPRPVDCRIEHP